MEIILSHPVTLYH